MFSALTAECSAEVNTALCDRNSIVKYNVLCKKCIKSALIVTVIIKDYIIPITADAIILFQWHYIHTNVGFSCFYEDFTQT